VNEVFFKLYDFNKDGIITQEDINSVMQEDEYTQSIAQEINLYNPTLIHRINKAIQDKTITVKNYSKKAYISSTVFNRITKGVSVFYEILCNVIFS